LKKSYLKIFQFFLDIIFPKNCYGCKKSGKYICENCRKNLSKNFPQTCFSCGAETEFGEFCEVCKKREKNLDGILVFYKFDEILRKAIHSYKYKFRKEVGVELSEIFRAKFFESDINFFSQVFVAPVPLHKNRLSWRGFNQSENLARSISFSFEKNDFNFLKNFSETKNNFQEKFIFLDLLERTKDTRPQVGLEKLEREKNIKNAFSVKKEFQNFVQEKTFLIVDDVVTTGSTLRECAKTLKNFGAKKVFGVCLTKSR